jgi:hypothetical protein
MIALIASFAMCGMQWNAYIEKPIAKYCTVVKNEKSCSAILTCKEISTDLHCDGRSETIANAAVLYDSDGGKSGSYVGTIECIKTEEIKQQESQFKKLPRSMRGPEL